jgi:hypothetical protein
VISLLANEAPVVLSDEAAHFAFGRVSIWGRVIETEAGFRAQYAYPYEIILLDATDAQLRDIRNAYRVDVIAEPVSETWRAEARELRQRWIDQATVTPPTSPSRSCCSRRA